MNAVSGEVKWTKNLEGYFKELGEMSLCLSMMHKKCESKFSTKAMRIDLPVIIFSTLCGSLTLSAKNMFGEENEEFALKIVGGLSLFSGILGTIQAYFSFSRRAENHRNSFLEYAKLYRFVKVELGLPRFQRIQAKDLLKIINDSFERLNELSPLIPDDVISFFKGKYKSEKLKKPPIVNGLEMINIYSPSEDGVDYSIPNDIESPKKKDLNKNIKNQNDEISIEIKEISEIKETQIKETQNKEIKEEIEKDNEIKETLKDVVIDIIKNKDSEGATKEEDKKDTNKKL
tara:strand:- start:272 stop:1135 length:864 start_codon:yes stop_codon:yes gene_type:complete